MFPDNEGYEVKTAFLEDAERIEKMELLLSRGAQSITTTGPEQPDPFSANATGKPSSQSEPCAKGQSNTETSIEPGTNKFKNIDTGNTDKPLGS
ncbi:MAG: hypothetical protein HOF21_07710 [Nitrospina sp.]|nr:hypothetical protein [Nitrospina sp.]MBT5633021.1 hypothetical protein [Nitrospina sp.]